MVILGQMPMREEEWAATKARLVTEGFVEDDTVVEGFMDGPDSEGESYVGRGFCYRDGNLYYSSYSGFLQFVPAFQV